MVERQVLAGSGENHVPLPLPPNLTSPTAVDPIGVGVGCVPNEVSSIEGVQVDITREAAIAKSVAAPGKLLLNLVPHYTTRGNMFFLTMYFVCGAGYRWQPPLLQGSNPAMGTSSGEGGQ